ncbi:DUF1064 domain-containing protein [Peribacillus acanthi]|uniref:DUF1064 domain-containing protein n=1 Tax=Peribacillus acanthi TaxID=2171554 RepID=UPI000D3E2FFB|nr:DUF1064 domain-containing protein [Peribacillus acanthi]
MSKYHAKKTIIDGITFDSKTESEYYLHLKEKCERWEIQAFNLQPSFVLQEGFKKDGKWHRPIMYIADFEILHTDGRIEIVDVKGFETADFKIKRKLFEKKYPYTLTLMKYVKKYGGWISVDEWKKLKRVK